MLKKIIIDIIYWFAFPSFRCIKLSDQTTKREKIHSELEILFDSSRYEIIPKVNRNNFFWLDFYKKSNRIQEVSYSLFSNVIIQSPSGAMLTDSKKVIMNTVRARRYYLKQTGIWKLVLKLVEKKEEYTIFSAIDVLGHNYYHFVIDVLTRFDTYDHFCKTNPAPKVLVNKKTSKFQIEWLELIGVPQKDIVELSSHIKVKRAIVPSLKTSRFLISKKVETYLLDYRGFEWLRKKVRSQLNSNYINDKFIYISRKNCQTRKIINENQLQLYLIQNGFEVVVLEDLSVKKQLEVFCSASKIIASHGAGLTNLIFADNRCSVIELFPKGRYADCASIYFQITERLKELLD